MGLSYSKHKFVHSTNDFELVVKSCKELEHILDVEFDISSAQQQTSAGKKGSLHEKITYVIEHNSWTTSTTTGGSGSGRESILPNELVSKMRYIATIRNKLVHEYNYNSLDNRPKFISNYEYSVLQLQQIVEERRRKRQGGGTGGGTTSSSCSVM